MKKPVQNENPLVSVVLPAYNSEKFIVQSIRSIQEQSYEHFELIIVDDLSTDATPHQIKKITKAEKRICFFQNPVHLGIGQTFNNAVKRARGKFIARADADDLMMPKRLEHQLRFLQANINTVVAVGSWTIEIDSQGKELGKRIMPTTQAQILEMMYYLMGMQNPTIMFNLNLIPKDFLWCKTTGFVDDLDLLFKLLPHGHFANLPEFLVKYRIHNDNTSLKFPKKTFLECQQIRQQAVKDGLYFPSSKAKMINLLEGLLISMTPESHVLSLYNVVRKMAALGARMNAN